MEDCRRLLQINRNAVYELGITPDMRVYKRIAHVLNAVLRMDLSDESLKALKGMLNSLSYQPPWDNESATMDSLTLLTRICLLFFPDNSELEQAFTEDLSEVHLVAELQEWLTV